MWLLMILLPFTSISFIYCINIRMMKVDFIPKDYPRLYYKYTVVYKLQDNVFRNGDCQVSPLEAKTKIITDISSFCNEKISNIEEQDYILSLKCRKTARREPYSVTETYSSLLTPREVSLLNISVLNCLKNEICCLHDDNFAIVRQEEEILRSTECIISTRFPLEGDLIDIFGTNYASKALLIHNGESILLVRHNLKNINCPDDFTFWTIGSQFYGLSRKDLHAAKKILKS